MNRALRLLVLPVVLVVVPRAALATAWEGAAAARLAGVSASARHAVRLAQAPLAAAPAAPADREALAAKALAALQGVDGLIAGAIARGEELNEAAVLKMLQASSFNSRENGEALIRLTDMLNDENAAEVDAEAKASSDPSSYTELGKAPIWDGFKAKVDALRARLETLAPAALFAEYTKLQLRQRGQQGARFPAPNQLDIEADFGRLRVEVFEKLGLTNIPKAFRGGMF